MGDHGINMWMDGQLRRCVLISDFTELVSIRKGSDFE